MADKQFSIRDKDLISNPAPRIAVCLCLDVSPSMSGQQRYGAAPGLDGVPIDEMNDGLATFIRAVREDSAACRSAEIAIVEFSGAPRLVQDFTPAASVEAPTLELEMERGGTSIGTAVRMCLDLLDSRKNVYKSSGLEYYQPWLVIMTDGEPTDDSHKKVALEVSAAVEGKKLAIFPIGIGSKADMSTLGLFSPKKPPLKLKGLHFQEFFEWLSKSVSRVSQSQVGEAVKLDLDGIKGWADL